MIKMIMDNILIFFYLFFNKINIGFIVIFKFLI